MKQSLIKTHCIVSTNLSLDLCTRSSGQKQRSRSRRNSSHSDVTGANEAVRSIITVILHSVCEELWLKSLCRSKCLCESELFSSVKSFFGRRSSSRLLVRSSSVVMIIEWPWEMTTDWNLFWNTQNSLSWPDITYDNMKRSLNDFIKEILAIWRESWEL